MWALTLCKKDELARKKFINFIEQCAQNGADDFLSMRQSDQCEAAGLYINALDDKTEWLVNSDHVDTTLKQIVKILTYEGNYDWNKTDLIDAIQKQAVSYFSNTLDEYVSEVATLYRRSRAKGE